MIADYMEEDFEKENKDMNIKKELETKVGIADGIYLNNIEIDPLTMKAVMVNEVVPSDPSQDFYGSPDADYLKTTISLFQRAGIEATSIQDILQKGIYITNTVKTPNTEYAISKSSIENSLPYLEAELSLFPNIKVIMLMGDAAKKAFNMIAEKSTKKNVIPALSTYKLRKGEIYYEGVRVMPSYIMAEENSLTEKPKVTILRIRPAWVAWLGRLFIEKSKVMMTTKDIAAMLEIIK